MGQYYRVYVQRENGEENVFNRQIAGGIGYTGAKLMEHSWYDDPFCKCVTGFIYKNPSRVAWVGDYSSEVDAERIQEIYAKVWGNNDNGHKIENNKVSLQNKYLVNHTKKIFMDCNKYCDSFMDGNSWIIHPLPLLTVVGNGMGGGDYYGSHQEDVGTWYMDLISVEDTAPEHYQETSYTFYE